MYSVYEWVSWHLITVTFGYMTPGQPWPRPAWPYTRIWLRALGLLLKVLLLIDVKHLSVILLTVGEL